MKQLIRICLIASLSAGFCACANPSESQAQEGGEENKETLNIVTTIFPAYEWCREVIGENPSGVKLDFLLDSGADLHSYQPTALDMLEIAEADLFVYVGGESDKWTKDALKQAVNPDLEAVSLMELLSSHIKEEEIVEGMEEEEEEHEEAEEEAEYDEHVWLSLRNAMEAVTEIADILSSKDAANAAVYQSNAKAYIGKLQALDTQYTDAVNHAEVKTLLFADRFPFRYLTDDYGLDYFAAFAGCSAETEASFETILFLSHKVDELNLHHVMTIENNDEKIAKTVIDNTQNKNQNILHLDSMQNITAKDAENGVTYLSVMEDNLLVLKQALENRE